MVDVFDAPRRSLLQTTIGSDTPAVGVWDPDFEAYKVGRCRLTLSNPR